MTELSCVHTPGRGFCGSCRADLAAGPPGRVSSSEQEQCPHQCGIWEIHARDGQTYFPPLVEVADCGLVAGHLGECVP